MRWICIPLLLRTLVLHAGTPVVRTENAAYERIVSLSPSTTEILFDLGLGCKVVGVTRFCTFPPEAKSKADVGGYIDTNYEAIALLEPDLVIILPEMEKAGKYISELDIDMLTVDNKTIKDILDSIETIARKCGAREKGDSLVGTIKTRMKRISDRTGGMARPRVMISVGRETGTGTLGAVYIAGNNTLYSEMISIAGGTNAYERTYPAYPMLSAEGIIYLDPQVIIDVVIGSDTLAPGENAVKEDWNSVSAVDAIEKGRLYVITDHYAVIPGPRFILFLERLARLIHPEIEWSPD